LAARAHVSGQAVTKESLTISTQSLDRKSEGVRGPNPAATVPGRPSGDGVRNAAACDRFAPLERTMSHLAACSKSPSSRRQPTTLISGVAPSPPQAQDANRTSTRCGMVVASPSGKLRVVSQNLAYLNLNLLQAARRGRRPLNARESTWSLGIVAPRTWNLRTREPRTWYWSDSPIQRPKWKANAKSVGWADYLAPQPKSGAPRC
jgi:hypothetical protein